MLWCKGGSYSSSGSVLYCTQNSLPAQTLDTENVNAFHVIQASCGVSSWWSVLLATYLSFPYIFICRGPPQYQSTTNILPKVIYQHINSTLCMVYYYYFKQFFLLFIYMHLTLLSPQPPQITWEPPGNTVTLYNESAMGLLRIPRSCLSCPRVLIPDQLSFWPTGMSRDVTGL